MVFKISFGRTFSDRHRGPRNLMSFHGYAVSTNQDELVSDPPPKKILDPPMWPPLGTKI